MSLDEAYEAMRRSAEEIAKVLMPEDIEGLTNPGEEDPWRLLDLDLLECDYEPHGDLFWYTTTLGKMVLEIVERRA